ncbi:MAG: response regulator [Euryarchaeota archaeon]|jgi:two-component system chemotaxis response regulator CheY|nr:response regulator [Euryarchaeota archaeon]
MPKTVLIVDDSEFMRSLLREILADDYEIIAEAENGVEAVELYNEHGPDLVMMDIVMPIRDGIEATTAITGEDSSARVIMCTSVGQEEKMKMAVKAGASGYITKPFQKPSVLEAIDDVIPA